VPRHIARWDLDKTYLRTEFDTLRDLVKTALERPDEKRTNPGASTLLREMVRAGISVHILSGSPEQMRRKLEDKLRLDGIQWDSFTLKPNLQNLLRLRLRAVKDQLGYKLPALLQARVGATPLAPGESGIRHETLFGDDAEADAFVYSLYADVLAGKVEEDLLVEICERGRVYPDVLEALVDSQRQIEPVDAVERILIHLERQTPPDNFSVYGARVVPFYNYLQAALVVHEDGRLPAEAVLRVAVELVVHHRFDGDALGRSYLDLVRRGHLRGKGVENLAKGFEVWAAEERMPGYHELETLVARLPQLAETARATRPTDPVKTPDYLTLVEQHNPRRARRR
jgi:hypothetical protein